MTNDASREGRGVVSIFGKGLGAALLTLTVWNLALASDMTTSPTSSSQSPFPPQIQMQVPFAPTAFPAEDGAHLLYELYITNFQDRPVTLDRVDVIDSTQSGSRPLASFVGHSLNQIATVAGVDEVVDMSDDARPVNINAGGTAVLFISVVLPSGAPLPGRLTQRLAFANGDIVEGPAVIPQQTRLKVLAAPVEGANWLAADGPGNGQYNHHRRGIFVIGGVMRDSRRFAVDWKQVENDASFHGDSHADSSYYAYGKSVFAVADAKVVEVRDGQPDNPPGHNSDFHPSLPVTLDNAGGNTVVLDLGDGQFAHYYHLKPGSIQVRQGQRVRVGQLIAHIGASGDAREPHLHFEVTTAVPLLAGEGIPYLIDHFRVIGGDGHVPSVRRNESPLDGMMIDFGKGGQGASSGP